MLSQTNIVNVNNVQGKIKFKVLIKEDNTATNLKRRVYYIDLFILLYCGERITIL
jgi:hypothetical protein